MTETNFAKSTSDAADEFEFFHKVIGEMTPLVAGDRVFFVTLDNEYPGTVNRDWTHDPWPSAHLDVTLDCRPDCSLVLHRSLFRAFSVLDHISRI